MSTNFSVLVIGDPHFRLENLSDLNNYIDKVIALIHQQQPSSVIVLGDILHTHEQIHTTIANKAYSFIHRISELCKVYVIVGNHDYINNSQFLTDAHWMNAMKVWSNVIIVDTGHVLHVGNDKFILCPYVFPGRFKEALDIIDSNWKEAKAIFCHQEFRGCKMGAIVSVDGDEWLSTDPFVIAGHIHDKQKPQANIYYPGSSMQHAFGESPNKTIAILTFEETCSITEYSLGMVKRKILYKDIDEMGDFEVPDTENKYRVTLSGTQEEFKLFKKSKQYKKLIKNGVKLVYRHEPVDIKSVIGVAEDFHSILLNLLNEKDKDLVKIYKELF